MWPETNIGVQVIRSCPCGNKRSEDGGILEATTYCGGDFINGATWAEANVATCNFSDLTHEICDLKNVSTFEKIDYNYFYILGISCKKGRTTKEPYQ